MWSIIISIIVLYFWWKSPRMREWFWSFFYDDSGIEEEIMQVEEQPRKLREYQSKMNLYLEKRKRESEKLGPAISAQGDIMSEWTSPSLEQFRELHQQSKIGGSG